jgi:predicted transcriptional regulator
MLEKFCNLLFELSHEDRLRIIFELQEKPMKLTYLSEKLDLKVQETSRHLSRLSDAKLITKDVEGFFHLTPYGEHVIKLLPGFDFLCKNRNYFTTHRSSHLPEAFVNRIGELKECSFTDDVMVAFHKVNKLIEEAEEYVWIISSQILMSTLSYLEGAIKRGVKFRLILPEDLVPPPGFKPIPIIPNRIERRTLHRVDIVIVMSEKLARIAFPTADDKMDHIGFGSTDEISHQWCKELFEYYWTKAKIGIPQGYPEKE